MKAITNSSLAFSILRPIAHQTVEEFWALALNPAKVPLRTELLFKGTVDACLVHPREIFRFALLANASSLIVAHNHPSQNSQPSEWDLKVTRQLVEASEILQIPLIDHLILTKNNYVSFADEGWI